MDESKIMIAVAVFGGFVVGVSAYPVVDMLLDLMGYEREFGRFLPRRKEEQNEKS